MIGVMAESFNLVLHIIAGLGSIGLILWVVKLQKRMKFQKLLMKSILMPDANIKVSGSFSKLLTQVCDNLQIELVCDLKHSQTCILSLGNWVREIKRSAPRAFKLKSESGILALSVYGRTQINESSLKNKIRFLKPTKFEINFIEEKNK